MKLSTRNRLPRDRRGMALLLSMTLLAMFAGLAAALANSSALGLRQTANQSKVLDARMAAESGLAFAISSMNGIQTEGYWEGTPDMVGVAYDHLCGGLNGTSNLGGQVIVRCGDTISVPSVSLPDGRSNFSFALTQTNDTSMRLTVTGQAGGITRRLAIDYGIQEDVSVLKYAVASRSRVVITDGAIVSGDICSTWDRTRIGSYDVPPFLTEADTQVLGELKTVMSQEDYDEYDSGDYVEGEDEGTTYNEPQFGDYETDDFDTSTYRAATTDITTTHTPNSTTIDDCFPSPSKIRRKLDRPIYEDQTFEDVCVPVGHNPKFVNCTFNRVTYIDTNESTELSEWSHGYYDEHCIPGSNEYRSDDPDNDHSNNVIFEDCTFNGPIITGVPRDYWWSKNALTFEGETTFQNSFMPESTIMAPNFGVDIGGRGFDWETNPNSVLTGVIIGGIVDIRGTANIEGTILSMYYPDTDRGTGARYYGSNIGYYNDGGEAGDSGIAGDIRIVPQPDNALPFGVRKRYTLSCLVTSYTEVCP